MSVSSYWSFLQNLNNQSPQQMRDFFEQITCHEDWRPDLLQLAEVLMAAAGLQNSSYAGYISRAASCAAAYPKASTNAYHNKAHTAHVAILCAYLPFQQKDIVLTETERAFLLLAAFAHDIDHPGRGNPQSDFFYNERNSCDALEPLLAGMPTEQRMRLRTMILATSPNEPHQDLKKIISTRQTRFKELGLLVGDRRLFEMTAILSDSDIMLSSGLGEAVQAEMSRRFTAETKAAGLDIDFNSVSARWTFFEKIVGLDGFLSESARRSFLSNYEAMRDNTIKLLGRPLYQKAL